MSSDVFSEEQKQYLQGFITGTALRGTAHGGVAPATFAATLGLAPEAAKAPAGEEIPAGPERIHVEAQNRFIAAGKELVKEEQAKRKTHPLDVWDKIRSHAQEKKYPAGIDVFLFKFNGLFYVAPAQDSFMCRLRFPGGVVSSHKLRGVAALAEKFGGGYADITTRANLQIREVTAGNTVPLLEGLYDIGIINRGAGADNIRNITGSPTAGIDPQELIDVRPLCRQLHHHIINHRELYGIPRKFNIGFDGGGSISVLHETNDIGFGAVRIGEGKAVAPGVYFRLLLAGITGHGNFAHDAGVIVAPNETVDVAVAVVRAFIDHGDRTDRKKARLKYVLDRLGMEKFLEEVEKHLGRKLTRLPADSAESRPAQARLAHIGAHPQKRSGLFYMGIVATASRLTSDQMRGLADIADRHGSGDLRLTVWQNLLITDIPGEQIDDVRRKVGELGLHHSPSNIRSGLVACTGNTGCRFSATDTKRHATEITDYLDARLQLDVPINIHLTGCPHSCAQHFIGDIGLLGAKVGPEMIEGYHLFVGGAYGARQEIGREILRDIPAADVPRVIESLLRGYVGGRAGGDESFTDFVRRHSTEELRALVEQQAVAA
jgi:ferredoxin-nitrite reductase